MTMEERKEALKQAILRLTVRAEMLKVELRVQEMDIQRLWKELEGLEEE